MTKWGYATLLVLFAILLLVWNALLRQPLIAPPADRSLGLGPQRSLDNR